MGSSCVGRLVGSGLRGNLRREWCFVLLGFLIGVGRATGDTSSVDRKAEAEHLVLAAANAQIRGNLPDSIALLEQAIQTDPQNRLAHWQLGEVRLDKKWMKVEEAQRQAARNRWQKAYQALRERLGESLDDQLELARWCRKRNLNDESRYHWANVLTAAPNNREAQRALGVRSIRGQLRTAAEIAADEGAERVRQREHLAASVGKWKGAVVGTNSVSLDEMLADIRSIDFPEAIPVIEDFIQHPDRTLTRYAQDNWNLGKQILQEWNIGPLAELRHRLCLAYVDAVVKMPEPRATEALARLAAFAPYPDVRDRAIAGLKTRPRYDYVPFLINGLGQLVPSQTLEHLRTFDDGSLAFVAATCPNCFARLTGGAPNPIPPGGTMPERLQVSGEIQRATLAASSARLDADIKADIHNTSVVLGNPRIIQVLEKTTGQRLGDDPPAWKKWWQNENDYYESPKQAVYQDYPNGVKEYQFTFSCFAKGTPVWTKTDRRPIESLKEGDLILAQNVDTGELGYKPVLIRTVRPPTTILKISLDGDVLQTTKGHPFWVAGTGWRMAKELGDGAVLCGLGRASTIKAIESAGEAEAYNLVVAEFNTYFVGEQGILVHDNTPRRPTKAILPGIREKANQ